MSEPARHVRTLVVTAVPQERDAVAAGCAPERFEVVAGGVGPAAAAAATARELTRAELAGRPYGLVVSAGICGGFAPVTEGPVVASAIVAADLGAENPGTEGGFTPVEGLGFGTGSYPVPLPLARAVADVCGAAFGPLLTVSTVTGSAERARTLAARHPGAVGEAMEGFGVAEAAALLALPVLEIRTVSNPVGPRDRGGWRIREALDGLTAVFADSAPLLGSWTGPTPDLPGPGDHGAHRKDELEGP
ncbi:futalosine hydrolase [Streptomyces tardus]|uniref:futalosine hydrolase n=1 Tax=Streptomyces tardus TaxID=2780544 RepID=UPI0035567EB0